MTDREEKILKCYTQLEGWVKRARDAALLNDKRKLREALNMVELRLSECERLE
jgi:hypothetical protein